MSRPAARQGDPTTHGGAITSGSPRVLIGGRPAASVGDTHACPVAGHVGGPITTGSANVLVVGRPAARQGDVATCNGPPDSIAAGDLTVLVGG